eukprot:PhF_6_TR22253/c0_g1_i1/m.31435
MSKKLILVRHAESVNNVDKREGWKAMVGLTSLTCPSKQQFQSLGRLTCFRFNTTLSPKGHIMVDKLREKTEADSFLARRKVDRIYHSHLERAELTCKGVFGGHAKEHGIPVEVHPELYEMDMLETMGAKNMLARVERVKKFLLQLPEDVQTIVLVGHSAFFRGFLGKTERMRNCEVFECVPHGDGTCE